MPGVATPNHRRNQLSARGVEKPVLLADHVELDEAALVRESREHVDIRSLVDMTDNEARGIDSLRFENLELSHPDRSARHLLAPAPGRVASNGHAGPPLRDGDRFESL